MVAGGDNGAETTTSLDYSGDDVAFDVVMGESAGGSGVMGMVGIAPEAGDMEHPRAAVVGMAGGGELGMLATSDTGIASMADSELVGFWGCVGDISFLDRSTVKPAAVMGVTAERGQYSICGTNHGTAIPAVRCGSSSTRRRRPSQST
jgi:hypothetical protein